MKQLLARKYFPENITKQPILSYISANYIHWKANTFLSSNPQIFLTFSPIIIFQEILNKLLPSL